MKKTARFNIGREQSLGRLFTITKLSGTWRSVVKEQMRTLDILDLHDYYDFNLNIEEKTSEIRNQILNAQYKASSPLIYRLEKRYGICRHLMIPNPSDALIFQVITDNLAVRLEKVQPTKQAYYSRDKHTLKLPHEMAESRGYPWSFLWPKFQKDIWKFTDDCDYLAVTDITNFFDNIGLRELRHIVSSTIKVDEVILDLLFNIIEQLSWTPDYLPASLKGLPTINLEAFRLLPHIMLFEIDRVLKKQAKGNFVRWMDDINIGINSKEDAYAIMGNLNDVLKSRGLALNLSKTTIFKASEAKQHFMFTENKYLDKVQKTDRTDPAFHRTKIGFLKHFRLHLKKTHLKNWDKVTKRYYTIAGRLKITELLHYSYQLYIDYPSVRGHILTYFKCLGFSKVIANLVLKLLQNVTRYDDVSLFDFCKLLTDIEVPRNKTGIAFINEINNILSTAKTEFDLYCYIWFLAKYGEPYKLINLILKTKKRWKNQQFLARQVVSVLPRLIGFNRNATMHLLDEQMTFGPRDASSVASNIHLLVGTNKVIGRLYSYLFPPKPQKPYPLSKYLILMSVLSSTSLNQAEKKRIAPKIKLQITDPWYLYWLKKNAFIIK